MTNELTISTQSTAIMPVMSLKEAAARRQAIVDFTSALMVNGVDYGVVPGTGGKPTLLKPGAEKLTSLFGLSPRFEIIEKDLDWTGDKHGGEPFFYFQYRCSLFYGDLLAGQGVGSCNSWEKKYRYRSATLSCPECGKEAIIKGKAEYGGGWVCFRKKGGCGYKFHDEDERITRQEVGQVTNENPADLVNTLDKMSQKRALVAATLIAVNASEFFTQDVEDMDFGGIIEGDYTEAPAPKPTPAPKQNGDARGDMAPEKQAARNPRKVAPAGTWEEKALAAKSFVTFCSAASFAIEGYTSDHHVREVLEAQPDFEYDPANNAEILAWLKSRKEAVTD